MSGEIWPTPASGVGGGVAFATVVFAGGGVAGAFLSVGGAAAACFCPFVVVVFFRLIGDGFCGLVGSGAGAVVVGEGVSAAGVDGSGVGVGVVWGCCCCWG